MKLFFDTETTGVPRNYKAPVTDLNNWPRLVQLGYIIYDTDKGGEIFEVYSGEHVVFPEGFEIPESVSKIHGITQAYALEHGEPLKSVLDIFIGHLQWADELIGHNLSYDLNVLGAEYLRVTQSNPLVGKSQYDTMLKGTSLCKLPGGYGGQYKWPKLFELYQKLFGVPLEQTHTALDDIRNTAKCYFELQKIGIV